MSDYGSMYQRLFADTGYCTDESPYRNRYVLNKLASGKYPSLIDVGSGRGRLVRDVSNKFPEIDILSTDVNKHHDVDVPFHRLDLSCHNDVQELADAYNQCRFSLLTCLDVLEHLEESFIEDVIAAFARVCNAAILTIANHSDVKHGVELHTIQRDMSYWRPMISRYFDIIEFHDDVHFRDGKPTLYVLFCKPRRGPRMRGTIPVYINNFNRMTTTRGIVEYLKKVDGAFPVIVDNGSSYPPLLEWYKTKPCETVLLNENVGKFAPWTRGCVQWAAAHRARFESEFYVVTDSDLDLSGVPFDVLDVLIEGWARFPSSRKIGLSLEINDLPSDSPILDSVSQWESKFWQERSGMFWRADIDTTFAMYRADMNHANVMETTNAWRTDRPYTARHTPWYITDDTITEEERYYIEANASKTAGWTIQLGEHFSGE